jgi:pimeloyl-ACP methyl ester carboxylesterase
VSTLASYAVTITDEQVEDLRRRLAATRWPEKETVGDWSQGIPLAYVRELAEYWTTEYDMQRLATRLNAFPQAKTVVGGLAIHHLHVRSDNPDAPALILTHGWPGSVVEFLEVIEPLRQDFHLVIPSLPGYGWSDKPTEPGIGAGRIAELWDELMTTLGYDEYYAQGGDWGGVVTAALGQLGPQGLQGIHVNFALCNPEALTDLTEEEQAQLGRIPAYLQTEGGYSNLQSTKPQTIGYALADSPVGQLAWIVEKFHAWTDNQGHPEDAVSRDDLLDNVMVYWLTNSAASSARLYWESFGAAMSVFDEVSVPSAYSAFPEDLFVFSERWTRTRYTDLRYFNAPPRGGHFAALEEPELFVAELRAGLNALAATS